MTANPGRLVCVPGLASPVSGAAPVFLPGILSIHTMLGEGITSFNHITGSPFPFDLSVRPGPR